MKAISAVSKVVFRGVSELASDYVDIAKQAAGDSVSIVNQPSLDPRIPDPINGNPMFTEAPPAEIANALKDVLKKDMTALLFFSTSTASAPLLLILQSQRIRFGLVEHSPTDGSTLAAWICQEGRFERFWTPSIKSVEQAEYASA